MMVLHHHTGESHTHAEHTLNSSNCTLYKRRANCARNNTTRILTECVRASSLARLSNIYVYYYDGCVLVSLVVCVRAARAPTVWSSIFCERIGRTQQRTAALLKLCAHRQSYVCRIIAAIVRPHTHTHTHPKSPPLHIHHTDTAAAPRR